MNIKRFSSACAAIVLCFFTSPEAQAGYFRLDKGVKSVAVVIVQGYSTSRYCPYWEAVPPDRELFYDGSWRAIDLDYDQKSETWTVSNPEKKEHGFKAVQLGGGSLDILPKHLRMDKEWYPEISAEIIKALAEDDPKVEIVPLNTPDADRYASGSIGQMVEDIISKGTAGSVLVVHCVVSPKFLKWFSTGRYRMRSMEDGIGIDIKAQLFGSEKSVKKFYAKKIDVATRDKKDTDVLSEMRRSIKSSFKNIL